MGDMHTALFQTEKDHAAGHASLMQAPTSLRVRVSDSANAAALVDLVAKHEAKLNAREEEMFRAALVSLDNGVAPSSMFLESVKDLSARRGAKLREIRDVVSGVVAQLAQQ